jgi:hypothetical protein
MTASAANPYAALAEFGLRIVGAGLASRARRKAIEEQGRRVNFQESLAYRDIENAETQAGEEAGAAMTDRMREAARALSMARLIAAEGTGSLAARAQNVNASAAEDLGRIDRNFRRTRFAFLQDREQTRINADLERQSLRNQGKANRYQFMSDAFGAAADAGLSYYNERRQIERERRVRSGR